MATLMPMIVSLARGSIVTADQLGRLWTRTRTRPVTVPADPHSILVWTMDRIGDVQRATPVFRQLRRRFPSARIAAVVAGRAAQVLSHNPHISDLQIVGSAYDIQGHIGVLRDLSKVDWDLGLLPEVDRCWAKIGQWTFERLGVPVWAEFELGNRMAPQAVPVNLGPGSWTDQFVAMASAVGAPAANGPDLDLFVTDQETREIREFMGSRGVDVTRPFFIVHPGGGGQVVTRQWPPEAFARLVDLLEERLGWPVVITGSGEEGKIACSILARTNVTCHNLCGDLSLRQLAALIAQESVCIMNDTGPLHMAHALKRPTTAILGPTAAEVVGIPATSVAATAGLPCQPCASLKDWKRCSNSDEFACLKRLTPEQVVLQVETRVALLDQAPKR